MFIEYLIVLKYFIFIFVLGLFLLLVSMLLVYQQPDFEKTSSYECGFNPWGDARNKFEVRFYLVSILFIIFDLEITFLFPWIVSLHDMSFVGFYTMVVFIFVLTVGFAYEWIKGALDWE